MSEIGIPYKVIRGVGTTTLFRKRSREKSARLDERDRQRVIDDQRVKRNQEILAESRRITQIWRDVTPNLGDMFSDTVSKLHKATSSE